MKPPNNPKIVDTVEIDYDGKYKLGTIIEIQNEYLVVRTFQLVMVPISWYRERMGWKYSDK